MSPEELLKKGLQILDIQAGDEAVSRFMVYLSELKKWNRTHNLTSITDEKEIVTKHFLDSALFLKAIEETGMGPHPAIADIGSGAGFPGLALKILLPGAPMTLIEPSTKKTVFLRHMKRKLSASGLEIVQGRVNETEGVFDIILTRALFSAGDFVKAGRHILREGGFFILGKGPLYEKEIIGVNVYKVLALNLPFTDMKRFLLLIRKE